MAARNENLRERAIEVTARLLDSTGNTPSMRQVSGMLGVSHVALYRYFDSSAAMLEAVAQSALTELIEALTKAQNLDQLVENYIQFAVEHSGTYDALMSQTNATMLSWSETLPLLGRLKATCLKVGLAKTSDIQFLWMKLHGAVCLFRQGSLPAQTSKELIRWIQKHH